MKIEELFSLRGKTAVITGASKGIGKELAGLMAAAGANVALVARDEAQLNTVAEDLSLEKNRIAVFPFDLLNTNKIPKLIDDILAVFGSIDILLNNAGINLPKPPEDVTEQDWDMMLDLNLKSVFFLSKEAGKHMKVQGSGKIINMSSQMAQVGYFGRTPYCASKGGITQLTKALAIEWASSQINVNAIAPTFIETPMTENMFKDKEFHEQILNRIPLGRLAKIEDLYGAALFLSSDSSSMVTGQTIYVDGGWTVW
ncbi:SDR family NAD(P)-dependent oxidoreductase [Alkalicoccus daliensis]|uniref:2-deoxy-D-gluconate 3-dehydrogenase n=1 Tax=Alkalicoccus daliensis TaxID=745820 RepID=A0A1H0GDP4_9BACI|nr:glucose 1-dehydrogenase [Alkalicoccus daliensis]SDO04879.1 2-deoxy-D-gluconate 3-dehydrogenase [Alkalicoccus daliensis]